MIERATGLLEASRPVNVLGAAVLTLVGAYVGGAGVPLWASLAATGAVAAAVAAGNTLNDYFDREIDAVNRPDRPIPRGAVSPRAALGWAGALFAVAVGVTALLPPAAIAIGLLNLLLLVTYTTVFKGSPGAGNLVVAYLVGSTFLYGAAAVGAVRTVLELAVLAGLATFAREVIKDVEDLPGDRAAGLQTLPVVLGRRSALWIGAGALVATVGVSPIPYLTGAFGEMYLFAIAVADLVALGAARASLSDPGRGQRLAKIAMFLAIGAFITDQALGV